MAITVEPRRSHAWCLFRSLSQPYALPLECVSEIVEVDRPVRLPFSPPEVIGLCPIRREVIPVVGLFDGQPAEVWKTDGSNAVLVLQAAQGIWGIGIDREGISVVEGHADKGDSDTPAGAELGNTLGIRRGDTVHTVINPDKTWLSLRSAVERWYRLMGLRTPSSPTDDSVAGTAL